MTATRHYNFAVAAMLDKKHDPWFRRKTPGRIYATCRIMSCQHPDWWYKDFIGIRFMGELIFYRDTNTGRDYLADVKTVILRGVMVHSGRSISPKDISIE